MYRVLWALCLFALACSGTAKESEQTEPTNAVATRAPVTDASGPTKPTGAAEARPRPPHAYVDALAAGRALAQAGKYPDAVLAFERALDFVPSDARALSELGFAAFKMNDLARAEAATLAAIAATDQFRLEAASLYNLGRIAEARGQRERAEDAYQRSLLLRPHPDVAQRLADLSKKQIAPILGPRPLLGPFSTLTDYCDQYTPSRALAEAQRDRLECDPQPSVLLGKSSAPFAAAQIFEVRVPIATTTGGDDRPESYLAFCQLGLRVGSSWYVRADLYDCSAHTDSARPASLAMVPGSGGSVLRVDFHEILAERHEESRSSALLVCGVGSSGRPSCTPQIVYAYLHEEPGQAKELQAQTVELSAEGLRIEAGDAGANGGELIGFHELVFE